MKNNIKDIENKSVSSRYHLVAFYSGAQSVYLPFKETYKELIDYLKHRRADYLVIDQRSISAARQKDFRRFFYPLLNDRKKHDGLIKVYVIEKPKKIVLYKVE